MSTLDWRLPPRGVLMPRARPPLVLADVGIGWANRRGPPPLRVAIAENVRERLWRSGLGIEEAEGDIVLTSDFDGLELGLSKEIARFGPGAGRSVTGEMTGPSTLRLTIRGGEKPVAIDVDIATRRVTWGTGNTVTFGYTAKELIELHTRLMNGDTSSRGSLGALPRRTYPVLVQLFGEGPALPYVSVRGQLAGHAVGLTLGVTPRDGGPDVAAFMPEGSDAATMVNEMSHLLWRAMETELAAPCGAGRREEALAAMETGEWFTDFRWPLAGFTYERLDKQMADELVSDVASVNTDPEDIFRIASQGATHPQNYGATVALMAALIRDLNSRRPVARRIADLDELLFDKLSPEELKARLKLDPGEIQAIQRGYLAAGQALIAHYRNAVRCSSLFRR